ncbi:hypothetical protein SETIT_1G273800v2 [Setaria italica]|uniref:Uncharacterized protein n=2 Tax=Setaria TaxID=4554 RepID=A0A368PPT7_SETIT|nr:hypothetical protein SETIT_1G273800v2 [Setaria italica]TKW40922.1 hypothetical protein SEVIR_1G279000v2 [Setaria viridis]
MAAAAACMCCQLLPPSCSMCSVLLRSRGLAARSIPLSLFTAPACEYCRGAVWEQERPRTGLPSAQLALGLDVRNDLAICRAWVRCNSFCNGMGRKLRRDGR